MKNKKIIKAMKTIMYHCHNTDCNECVMNTKKGCVMKDDFPTNWDLIKATINCYKMKEKRY
ncbi:hypothetical protein [uncultured Robinsoniella sp.]|uniref:hypothetical protein n=1 Tax=uncultured Robinsoniella sp. TaxID=904190 RepID=UPI002914569F|nr:hypothetical protein [Clostridiales bacterium]